MVLIIGSITSTIYVYFPTSRAGRNCHLWISTRVTTGFAIDLCGHYVCLVTCVLNLMPGGCGMATTTTLLFPTFIQSDQYYNYPQLCNCDPFRSVKLTAWESCWQNTIIKTKICLWVVSKSHSHR